jgi:hypothetical protein
VFDGSGRTQVSISVATSLVRVCGTSTALCA